MRNFLFAWRLFFYFILPAYAVAKERRTYGNCKHKE
nr:MAG TPA: hypothetical protein [Caudoviricetes sp.]